MSKGGDPLASGATYIFLCAEYRERKLRLRRVIAEARASPAYSAWNCIRTSARAYLCGESFRACGRAGRRLDVAMDFDSCETAGSRLGTGNAIVPDGRTCPVGALQLLERFFARESCRWCTPCRDGLPCSARLLQAIESGQGSEADLDIHREYTRLLGMGNTFCAHAPGAWPPLESGLELFADDFARSLSEGRCPYVEM